MKKIKLLGIILAITMALTVIFSGCSLITTDSDKDLAQVVASVDISKAENFEEEETDLAPYARAVGETDILKSQLISYFLNVGYSSVQSGMTYSNTFNMLLTNLIENAVVVQYAKMYLLDKKAKDEYNGAAEKIMADYTAFETEAERLEFLLGSTGVGTDSVVYSKDVYIARYSLMNGINSSIDSYEIALLESEDANAGTSTRSTPANVDTENEDYYPEGENGSLDYNVYTGYSSAKDGYDYTLANSGAYKTDRLTTFEGYTPVNSKSIRVNAYSSFISVLVTNGLVDAKTENVRDVMSLAYVQDEYVSQLESRVLEKYYDMYEEEQQALLEAGDEAAFAYVQEVYEDLLSSQEKSYEDSESFTTALGNMSDSSFVLYAPNTSDEFAKNGSFGGTYGFVYNILLPYSEAQKARLTAYQNDSDYKDDNDNYNTLYYNARNALLKQIKTTDQRDAWFNGTTDYSFDAAYSGLDFYSAANGSNYLFFENNLLNSQRYESLDKYAGLYAFNGTVVKNANGTYNIIKNELTIDDMLAEFSSYIDFVLGSDGNVTFDSGYTPASGNESYYNALTNETLYKDYDKDSDDNEIDYSNFVYASGKVNLGETDLKTLHNNVVYNGDDNAQYKVLSAVNELQYAYTTDTGVLSQYVGYSVSLYDTTGYIKEFEYAAHSALAGGAGTFAVCAGDYGWHIIYVTFTFDTDGGEVYSPVWTKEQIDKEGTFENLFYEWIKSNDIEDASTTRKSWIVTKYSLENTTVVKYQDRYQNLLDLDN